MSTKRDMPDIDKAINAESWEWLQNAAPELADAVLTEAKRKTPPKSIYRHILRRVGPHREPLALRCRQAADHLQSDQ